MTEGAIVPCDHVIAKLWEYIDGELDSERSREIERHLDACARCFPEYDFRRAYRVFVRKTAVQTVPVETRRRVFAAILEEEHRRGGVAGGRGRRSIRERLRAWVAGWLPRA